MYKLILVILCLFIGVGAYAENSYNISFENGIYHITIPYNKHQNRINFILSDSLVTNKTIHKQEKAIFTLNTGFFDPNNGKTISYIYTNGKEAESPLFNENLINNPYIMANWNKISNRPEFRVIKQNGCWIYDITEHNTPYQGELITSAQGGPMLVPDMDLEKEFFVVKNSMGKVIRESASVLHKTARTIIGLKDNNIHILIITDKTPMTIYEARDLCKKLGFDKAMAFDGGSSTSFDYKNKIHIISTGIKGDDTGRKLKSFLIYK